jgi:hypothetical protein
MYVQDTMEEVKMKMEDIERWETLTNESSQSLEFRLQKLEEIAQQTASNLAVIHRFMSIQSMESRPSSRGSHLEHHENISRKI